MKAHVTATVSEIAQALGISRTGAHKRASKYTPINETGVAYYDIDAIEWRKGEAAKIRCFLRRKHRPETPEVDTAAETLAQDTADHERQRIQERLAGQARFDRRPEWQQRGAKAKLEIIKASERYIRKHNLARTAGQNAFADEYCLGRGEVPPWVLAEVPHLHPGTLRNWIAEEYKLGIDGLVDNYANRKGQSKIDTYITGFTADGAPVRPYAEAILAVMQRAPHVKPKIAWEFMLGCCPGGPDVSEKSVSRWMEAWKKKHAEEWAWLVNPDKAKGSMRFSVGRAAEHITGPNQRWEIDVTPADLLLTDGSRWKIIGMIDVGVRRLKLVVKQTEKAADNADLVRRCLIDWGVPVGGVLYTDNGSAYKSVHFSRIMSDLEIEQHFCKPFESQEKPFIERAFRTFSHDLVEHLDGYCGHNVAQRKDIESRKSFAKRLFDKEELIEVKMNSTQLQQFIDEWLFIYHETEHSGLGMTPNMALMRWPHPLHRVADEHALDVLLAPVAGKDGTRVISKGTIKIDNYEYIHHLFALHGDKTVFCRQTDDLGKIIVEIGNEAGGRDFLCVAECPEITDISRAEVTEHGKALQKRMLAEARAEMNKRKKEFGGLKTSDVVMSLRKQKIAERNKNVTHLPKQQVEYTTSALEAAAEARAALDGAPVKRQPPPLTPDQQAMKERLKAEFEAKQTSNVCSLETESARSKFKRMQGLRAVLTDGGSISEEEYKALMIYEQSNEYRVFKGLEEESAKAVK